MVAKLRVAQRLVERLRGEVRVFGLKAPARVRFDGARCATEVEDSADACLAQGFALAAQDMLAFDLERRAWAGRTAEWLGFGVAGGLPAPELDIFVRLLGLADAAARVVRGMSNEERRPLEGLAAGVNAWIDAGLWEGQDGWRRLGSRPRLVGPVDFVLVVHGRERASRLVRDVATLDAPPRWDRGATEAVQRRLRGVQHLTDRGGPAAGAELNLDAIVDRAPVAGTGVGLFAEEVLPGGDDHRVVTESGWVRMSVERPTIAVRNAAPRRPWLRQAPRGALISDLLVGAEDARPPTGPAFSFAWERDEGEVIPRPPPTPRSGSVRLVPLTEGA